MLIVLMLVPALEPMEMMYGIAAEAVYILFLFVRFGTNGFEVFNVLLMNVLLYLMSRYLFKHTIEHIRLKERVKDSDGGADVDKMTGLLSRKGFERRAYQSIMASVRARKRFSILEGDVYKNDEAYFLAHNNPTDDPYVFRGEYAPTVHRQLDILWLHT